MFFQHSASLKVICFKNKIIIFKSVKYLIWIFPPSIMSYIFFITTDMCLFFWCMCILTTVSSQVSSKPLEKYEMKCLNEWYGRQKICNMIKGLWEEASELQSIHYQHDLSFETKSLHNKTAPSVCKIILSIKFIASEQRKCLGFVFYI